MENRIITVTFKDSNTATANGVRQWDYGQILRIQGLQLPTAVEVHFALIDSKDSVTRIGTTKDGVTDVVIPDSMIEAGKNIFAYVYLRDSESGQTEYEIKIVVTTRAKPEAFDTPEDKELFAQAIEAVNEAADRAEKAGQTATEAAGQAAEDAQQTAEDRKEVEKMVETVSDISEQVKKVEQLSQQAQDAADKTEADAQQTAEDRVEVGKMLENVKDISEQVKSVDESVRKAKESEQAAAGHRTAVEEMKNSVEQTASTFPQTVQSGIQAVENAGTAEVQEITQAGATQKTAVEGAGTQAVESVENVKVLATEAVEAAKTTAVQAVKAEGTKQTGNVTTEGTKQVKSVQDKGIEVLQSIPENFPTQMETKLDKQQGIENKGKALVIGEDGNVVPGEVASGGGDGIAIINTMSGESPLVIPDSAERPLERLELGGKTEQNQDPPPSPEYLQEIKNSGKWNEEKQKYEVDVKVTGKNLLNLQKEPDVKGTYQGWKVGNGELLTLGVKDKGNNADIKGCYIGFSDQGSEPKGAVWVVDNGVIKTNPLNQRKAYVSIFPANETAVKKLTERFDIQCELGNVATPYQPYKEQTLTLTSDRPITKWDKLVEQGGEIGWLHKHKIIEDFSMLVKDTEPIYGNDGGKYFSVSLQNASLNYDRSKIYSEVGVYGKDNKIHYIPQPMMANVIIYVSDTDTIMTAKEHMHYKVIYETIESQFIPLPQSEQNAIRALKTYYPTTVITADGGEAIPTVEVTYTADTKNYIDGKLSAKVASVLRQYQADTVNLLSLMPMETQAAMIENDTNNILENAEEMKHE